VKKGKKWRREKTEQQDAEKTLLLTPKECLGVPPAPSIREVKKYRLGGGGKGKSRQAEGKVTWLDGMILKGLEKKMAAGEEGTYLSNGGKRRQG